jgi:hypothetical protein
MEKQGLMCEIYEKTKYGICTKEKTFKPVKEDL